MTMVAEPKINEDIQGGETSEDTGSNNEINMMDLIAEEHAINGEAPKTGDKTPLPQDLTEHRTQLEEELPHGYIETQPTQSLTDLLGEMIENPDSYHERTRAMQNGTYNKGEGSDNPTITPDTLVNTDEAVQGYVRDAERKVSKFAEEAGNILGKDGARTRDAITEVDQEAKTAEHEVPTGKKEIEEAKTDAVEEMAKALYEERLMMEQLAKKAPSAYASRADSQEAVYYELEKLNEKGQKEENDRNLERMVDAALDEINDTQNTPIERGDRWKTPEQVIQERRLYIYESRPPKDEAKARREAIKAIENNKVLHQLLDFKTDAEREKFLTNFRSMAKVMGVDSSVLQEELDILSRNVLNPVPTPVLGEEDDDNGGKKPNKLKTAWEINKERGYKKVDGRRYGPGGLNKGLDEAITEGQKEQPNEDEEGVFYYNEKNEKVYIRRPNSSGGSGGNENNGGRRTGGPGDERDDDSGGSGDESNGNGKTIQQRLKEGEMIKAGEFKQLSYEDQVDVLFDQERRQKIERQKIKGQMKRVLGEEELFGEYTLGSIKNLLKGKDHEMVRYIYERLAKEASILVGSQWYRAQKGKDKGIEDPLEIREIHTILDERNKIRHFRMEVLKPMIDEFDQEERDFEAIKIEVREDHSVVDSEIIDEGVDTTTKPKEEIIEGEFTPFFEENNKILLPDWTESTLERRIQEEQQDSRRLRQEDKNPLMWAKYETNRAIKEGKQPTVNEIYSFYLTNYRALYGSGSRASGELVYTYDKNPQPLTFEEFIQLISNINQPRENAEDVEIARGDDEAPIEEPSTPKSTPEPAVQGTQTDIETTEGSLLDTEPSLKISEEPEEGVRSERDRRQRQEVIPRDNEIVELNATETQGRSIQNIANELRTSSALETLRQTLIDPDDDEAEGNTWFEQTIKALETKNINELTSRIEFLQTYADYLTGESENQEKQGNSSEAGAAKSNADEVNRIVADMQAILNQATEERARQRIARRLYRQEQQENLNEQNGYEGEENEN